MKRFDGVAVVDDAECNAASAGDRLRGALCPCFGRLIVFDSFCSSAVWRAAFHCDFAGAARVDGHTELGCSEVKRIVVVPLLYCNTLQQFVLGDVSR